MNRIPLVVLTLFAAQLMWGQGEVEQVPAQQTLVDAPVSSEWMPLPQPVDLKAEITKNVMPYTDAEAEADESNTPTTGPWLTPGGSSDLLLPLRLSSGFGIDNGFGSWFDSPQTQDLPPAVKPRLLPDNMSFLERGLWGEEGFFRNIGIASPLTPEVRKHELAVRRTMLTMHQIGGFATLASMLTTVYFGQKYLDRGQRNDLNMHQTFIPITIGLYSATALLSVLSPPPMIRRDEISTTSIHKTLAWIHVAGMILTPILGAAISKRDASYYDKARVHQVAAYITTAVFAASMIIITF